MPGRKRPTRSAFPRIQVRPATPRDAALLARHRAGMFRDMGRLPAGDRREGPLMWATEAFARRALRSGELVAWVAEAGGLPLGSGGLLVRNLMPNPAQPKVRREAYVLNMFTEPEARRRGVASAIVRAILAWCRRAGVARASLHASNAGRPVYERFGFAVPGALMEWRRAAPRSGKRR